MVTFGEPVNKSLNGKVLQDFIERAGGFPGLVEKTLMDRCGHVFDIFGHYRIASR